MRQFAPPPPPPRGAPVRTDFAKWKRSRSLHTSTTLFGQFTIGEAQIGRKSARACYHRTELLYSDKHALPSKPAWCGMSSARSASFCWCSKERTSRSLFSIQSCAQPVKTSILTGRPRSSFSTVDFHKLFESREERKPLRRD